MTWKLHNNGISARLYSNHIYILFFLFGHIILTLPKDCLSYKKKQYDLCFPQKLMHILTLFLSIVVSLNSMIRLHLRTLFWHINPLGINFPNHLIPGLDFPQTFIPITQDGLIWAVLMYLLIEPNYMEKILFELVQFLLGNIFKIFIEIFHKLITNSLKKQLIFFGELCLTDFSHNVSSFTLNASKVWDFLFNWNCCEISYLGFSVAHQESSVEGL